MTKVKILGTEYKIYTKVPKQKDESLRDLFGYCAYAEKKIVAGDVSTYDGWRDEPVLVQQNIERETLRHEILHAFFERERIESKLFWYGMLGHERRNGRLVRYSVS